MNNKKVYIAYTGGTIGMAKTEHGYQPESGLLQKIMAKMPEFEHHEMPHYDIHEYTPLIDSANMQPEYWNAIANDIKHHYHDYDGFVILHGTDTMAYTASALSFMLQDLQKPVIITGSQIPLVEIRNDVKGNLINSLLLAANYSIPEVCIFFSSRLYRGNRCTKINASSFKAFTSPKFPALAKIGINIEIRKDLMLPVTNKELSIQNIENNLVSIVHLFPGMSLDILKNVIRAPLQALILLTYGVGNASQNPEFLELLQTVNEKGVITVNCSQCIYNDVSMDSYTAGQTLAKTGIISAGDMTIEATVTKLLYLLSKYEKTATIKQKLIENLCGELGSIPVAIHF